MTLLSGKVSMTKKEQAKESLRAFLIALINTPLTKAIPESANLDNVIATICNEVHAIDEAEREEQGVVDVQEIVSCGDCNFCETDCGS